MDHEPHEPHERLLYANEVFQIQGAIFEVNRHMGSGFLEAVYQECLAVEPQQVVLIQAESTDRCL